MISVKPNDGSCVMSRSDEDRIDISEHGEDQNPVIRADEEAEEAPASADQKDWQLWPPSPKMQIVLIALAFGAFNLILLAIWAIVMVYRFQ